MLIILGELQAGHKAPSTKRCIKTLEGEEIGVHAHVVIKHRAPNGALRPGATLYEWQTYDVIKRRALNGALRRDQHCYHRHHHQSRHKAPSTKRRIKTVVSESERRTVLGVSHNATSAKGCIKTQIEVRGFLPSC